jgi:integrase
MERTISEQNSRLMVQYKEEELEEKFRRFMTVDLQLRRKTVYSHVTVLHKLINYCDPLCVDQDTLRDYLQQYIEQPKTYAWHLCGLKRLYRDFLKVPWLVESFKFPKIIPKPKLIPSKKDLKEFASYLDLEDFALFIMLASSGLRRSEVVSLQLKNVNFERRMVIPSRSSSTKFAWIGFFNEEAKEALEDFIKTRKDSRSTLLPYARAKLGVIWLQARRKSGIEITPQVLREWFAEEMTNLGVSERYIDAFCGRIPRSVLAKHYTDYRPEKLKPIYDKAKLKVLA